MIKTDICKIHGFTVFQSHKAKGKIYWHCRLCNNEKRVKRKQASKIKAIQYKGGKCAHCGLVYTDCAGIFDFHHIDPSTKTRIKSGSFFNYRWDTIKKELDKCIMLCANCHRRVHY